MVSDHDATDKTPMCEMPLIFMFEVLGLGRAFFVLRFWVLAFRHWRFVPRSQPNSQWLVLGTDIRVIP